MATRACRDGLIFYRIDSDIVQVLHVLHLPKGAQDLQALIFSRR